MDLNYELMNEIGLEIDCDKNLTDQDTLNPIQLNGKNLKYSLSDNNIIITKNDILFDPFNDPKMMLHIFGYFLNKISRIDNVRFTTFYPVMADDNKGYIELKGSSGTFKSKCYHNDSLKYFDLIKQINGHDNVDLPYMTSEEAIQCQI